VCAKGRDLLRRSIFKYGEIRRFEPGNKVSTVIRHHNVNQHLPGFSFEYRRSLIARILRCERLAGEEKYEKERSDKSV
jgi:hypothetical protein